VLKILSLVESLEYWDRVVDIFYESSYKKEFNSEIEKNDFLYKYLGIYKDKYPDLFLVAVKNEEVLGYICGVHDSKLETSLYDLLPHYSLFEDLYAKYPAHLHINLSSKSRGLGVGSILIEAFEELSSSGGIHLITGPKARNRSFYLKNNYSFECIREFKGLELLFMGKTL
jgi:GNAT superfamily N-acetyltransferase